MEKEDLNLAVNTLATSWAKQQVHKMAHNFLHQYYATGGEREGEQQIKTDSLSNIEN